MDNYIYKKIHELFLAVTGINTVLEKNKEVYEKDRLMISEIFKAHKETIDHLCKILDESGILAPNTPGNETLH